MPVVVAHGIWDSEQRIGTLVEGLRARGVNGVRAFTFRPRDGRAPLRVLADQLAREVERDRRAHGVQRVDVVGFSMGALVTRYYVQRLSGRDTVHRFVSISGPHQGTRLAYALPLAGVRDMRPGSALLRDLERDPDPWGPVEAHCIYTPLDLTIVPARSSEMRGARSTHRVPVRLHRWMIADPRVQDLTAAVLLAPRESTELG